MESSYCFPDIDQEPDQPCPGCMIWGENHIQTRPAWADLLSSDSSASDSDSEDTKRLVDDSDSLMISELARRDGNNEESLDERNDAPSIYHTAMTSLEVENHFTVFVRLPFNRGDFVDPPPVNWSAAKERELWDILSRQTNNQVDWKALAERFNVTQPFVLQKAAWLYERQLSQVRAQMRRVGNRVSATPSPTPSSVAGSMVGGQAMRRAGSGGSRVPSRLSTQQVGSPVLGGGDSTPGTPVKSRTSIPLRTASAAAGSGPTQQTRLPSGATRPLSRQSSRDADVTIPTSHSRRGSIQHQMLRSPGQARTAQPESSSSEDEMTQSRMTTRRPNPSSLHRRALSYRTDGQPQKLPAAKTDEQIPTQQRTAAEANDEDEDDEPSFLPFANPSTEIKPRPSSSSQQDPSATLRGVGQARRPSIHRRSTSERIVNSPVVEPPTPIQTQRPAQDIASSTSSVSSPPPTTSRPSSTPAETQAHPSRPQQQQQSTAPRLGTPLSPSHRALLLSNQPGSPRRGPGSDSASPSMGSSFSDLDDASVTQSALEEALLSGMGNTTMTNLGGFGGRVTSGIGQVLRSRYFDARGEAQGQGQQPRGGGGVNGGQGPVSER